MRPFRLHFGRSFRWSGAVLLQPLLRHTVGRDPTVRKAARGRRRGVGHTSAGRWRRGSSGRAQGRRGGGSVWGGLGLCWAFAPSSVSPERFVRGAFALRAWPTTVRGSVLSRWGG